MYNSFFTLYLEVTWHDYPANSTTYICQLTN